MQVTQRTMDQNGDILGPLTALPHSDNMIILYPNGKKVELLQNDGLCHFCTLSFRVFHSPLSKQFLLKVTLPSPC